MPQNNPSWLTSQAGRTVLITGANSGTGYRAAEMLARAGAHVILACRSPQRSAAAVVALRVAVPEAVLHEQPLDLADLDSVHRCCDALLAAARPLDLLLNNAGVMAIPRRVLTPQGFEAQFATNHLGHFVLTCRLLPLLQDRHGSRVVSMSSLAHRQARILDFANLQGEQHYGAWDAYGRSKLCNLLFAFELQRRLRRQNLPTQSLAAHPGFASTNLAHNGPALGGAPWWGWLLPLLSRPVSQSDRAGAWPLVFAATHAEAQGGAYYGPCGLLETRGAPGRVETSHMAQNEAIAARLWETSAELCGLATTI